MMKITPKSGIIAAVVGCVAGAILVIHTNIQCKKDKEEMDEIMDKFKEMNDHINGLID
jgi:formiminotetrahydrofolate cyclodeaminase